MYLTPKQVQEKFGYHPKSLSRWADEGKIKFTKSPGVHRRYLLSSLSVPIILNVMHCFSSKLYFLRSYEKKIKSEMDKTDKKS